MPIWLWLFFAAEPLYCFECLEANEVEIRSLAGIDSPTAMTWHAGELYLGADLMEPKPGIYRLHRPKDAFWSAQLVHYLPQQEIQGLAFDGEGRLHVASSRFFSNVMGDWKNQHIVLDHDRRRALDRQVLPIDNLCGDGKPECGIVAVFPEGPKRLFAVTKQRVARLYQLDRMTTRTEWKVGRALSLKLTRKSVAVTEVQRHKGRLFMLLPKQRLIAATSLESLSDDRLTRIELQPVFDFGRIEKLFVPVNSRLGYLGLAEGFACDDRGYLYLVLNNRGFRWRKAPDGVLDHRPKLLIFKPGKDLSPKGP